MLMDLVEEISSAIGDTLDNGAAAEGGSLQPDAGDGTMLYHYGSQVACLRYSLSRRTPAGASPVYRGMRGKLTTLSTHEAATHRPTTVAAHKGH